jgi:hypothetical protein
VPLGGPDAGVGASPRGASRTTLSEGTGPNPRRQPRRLKLGRRDLARAPGESFPSEPHHHVHAQGYASCAMVLMPPPGWTSVMYVRM